MSNGFHRIRYLGKSLWDTLVEPSEKLSEVKKDEARLLSTLVILLLTIYAIRFLANITLAVQEAWDVPFILSLFSLSYILSRTRFFEFGSLILSGTLLLLPLFYLMYFPWPPTAYRIVLAIIFGTIAIILASITTSPRFTLLLLVFQFATLVLLLQILPFELVVPALAASGVSFSCSTLAFIGVRIRYAAYQKILNQANRLEIREKKYRALAEQSLLGIIILQDNDIFYSNSTAIKMLHVDWTEFPIEFSKFLGLFHQDDRSMVTHTIDSTITNVDQHCEVRLLSDSETKWISIHTNIISYSGELVHQLVLSDVTQRKRIEQERDATRRELELYTYLLQHDLSNDIQHAILSIENLQLDLEEIRERDGKSLEAIKSIMFRMGRVLNVFSYENESQSRCLVEVLQLVIHEVRRSHENLKITFNVLDDEGVCGHCGSMLAMVFENLFRNVIQHVGSDAKVDIVMERVKSAIQVRFSDNGPGIPESIRPNIFEKQYSTRGSSGMGLYLSRQILQACNGSIELLSSTEGTSFLISIPASD
ncbi:MAG: PAS domain S-box protein [Candidatus Lokiarchaeota archaeon]|nr:PAS domain S-box protein [Candidatus Lokiarchaeota archaeon]